ncbi:hypothetical protein, partial [Bartonella sp. MR168JLCBS]|uniref:hypothetical protein n=1 Tax=Bartonella sp. MR168JLCBS TaxID=3243556 RepID=UPI0035CF3DA8
MEDDVMDVFVCIMKKFLRRVPYPFKKRSSITQPGALFMSGQPDACESTIAMVRYVARHLKEVDIVILPIVMHGHFHVVVLDNEKEEYRHYSSYDSDEHAIHAFELVTSLPKRLRLKGNMNFIKLPTNMNFYNVTE